MSVIPIVPYLSTELAGCLMSPKIIRDVRKQVRHPKLSRKKEKNKFHSLSPDNHPRGALLAH